MTLGARLAGALLVAGLASSSPASAQIRASEIGSVSQIIDGTKITIQGSRPRARGRDTLFGTKAVHWDEVWTPGANWATTFETSRNVTVNGRAVPKGKYSMWMVVRKDGDWTLVLDPKDRIYHMEPPDSNATQIRFPVTPEAAPFTEVLTWTVPEIRASGATIAMNWERKRIPMRVEVEPSLTVTMPRTEAEPYIGRYAPDLKAGDTTMSRTLVVLYENGTMKAEYDPTDNYMKRFAMIRIAPDWFVPGLYDRNGQIYEVIRPEMIYTFTRTNGRVTGMELRDEDDKVQERGTKQP